MELGEYSRESIYTDIREFSPNKWFWPAALNLRKEMGEEGIMLRKAV